MWRDDGPQLPVLQQQQSLWANVWCSGVSIISCGNVGHSTLLHCTGICGVLFLLSAVVISVSASCIVVVIGQQLQLQVHGCNSASSYCMLSQCCKLRLCCVATDIRGVRSLLWWQKLLGPCRSRACRVRACVHHIHITPPVVASHYCTASVSFMRVFSRTRCNCVKRVCLI